jgi:2,4-dienoyl-CoA reductase-like NADH-dependent reductase (Old Yellow Enzyme family)
MSSQLFSPIKLNGLSLPNRIVIAPMCQYSAVEGAASDWHIVHLGNLALSGAGLLIVEATHVTAQGRITPRCLGLYDDANEAALARAVEVCKRYGNVPIGVQLAHAGRKASCKPPSEGGTSMTPEMGGWPTVAPSAVPFAQGWQTPGALDRGGMDRVCHAFVAAVRRCERIGFDLIELHSAHGYLMSEFLSPIANRRTDDYGGSLENRMRFPLEVFSAMRAAWPKAKPLGVRLNGTDWDDRGITIEEAITFGRALKERGCDFLDVSGGSNSPVTPPAGPGYQVPSAAKVKAGVGLPTMAVGMITEPHQAEAILAQGKADMVALARGMLYDPRWPWHAAEALGAEAAYPIQHARAHPARWPQAFAARRAAE